MSITIVIKQDSISEEDTALIDRLMTAVEITNYKIINIKFYRLDKETEFAICLGKTALLATRLVINLEKTLELPELENLHDKPGNDKWRAQAYHALKDLHEYIDIKEKSDKIDLNLLPSLDTVHLLQIQKDLLLEGIVGFTAINQAGNKVRVRVDESDKVIEDINIHISELILLKTVQEIFEINTKIPVIVSKSKEK